MVGKAGSGSVAVIHKPQSIVSGSLCNNGAAVHGLAGADTIMVVGVAGSFSVHRGGHQLAARSGKIHAVAVGERIADLVISDGLAVVAGQQVFPVVVIVGVRSFSVIRLLVE